MQLSVRTFLYARFLAMVAWVLLITGAYLAYKTVAPHIASDFLRWILDAGTVALSITLGLFVQRRVLHWLDPDGELRRQVRAQAEAARDER